jgi:hypothetical protein
MAVPARTGDDTEYASGGLEPETSSMPHPAKRNVPAGPPAPERPSPSEGDSEPGRHETLGAVLRSLLDAVLLPDQLLGTTDAAELRSLQPDLWYPVDAQIERVKRLHALLGDASLRKVGWSVFALNHEADVRRLHPSVRALLGSFDTLYKAVNRGPGIGGWQVTRFAPGEARLVKTTPFDCVMEEGILEAAFRSLHIPVVIRQEVCRRDGGAHCEIALTSNVVDARWTG